MLDVWFLKVTFDKNLIVVIFSRVFFLITKNGEFNSFGILSANHNSANVKKNQNEPCPSMLEEHLKCSLTDDLCYQTVIYMG